MPCCRVRVANCGRPHLRRVPPGGRGGRSTSRVRQGSSGRVPLAALLACAQTVREGQGRSWTAWSERSPCTGMPCARRGATGGWPGPCCRELLWGRPARLPWVRPRGGDTRRPADRVRGDGTGSRGAFVHDAGGGVDVRFKASGATDPLFSALAEAEAGALVRFTKRRSALVVYRGMAKQRDDRHPRARSPPLVRRYWQGRWDAGLLAVTEVVRADAAAVLVAAGTDAAAELRLAASVGPGPLQLLDLAGAAQVAGGLSTWASTGPGRPSPRSSGSYGCAAPGSAECVRSSGLCSPAAGSATSRCRPCCWSRPATTRRPCSSRRRSPNRSRKRPDHADPARPPARRGPSACRGRAGGGVAPVEGRQPRGRTAGETPESGGGGDRAAGRRRWPTPGRVSQTGAVTTFPGGSWTSITSGTSTAAY